MPNIETIFDHTSASGSNGELGIDENGNLYWNNKPVTTEKKVKLEFWVNISIIATAIATICMMLVAIAEYLKPIC